MNCTTVRRLMFEEFFPTHGFGFTFIFFQIITTNESRYNENQSNNCNNWIISRIHWVSVVCLFIDLLKNIMKLISETWFLIFNIFGVNVFLSNAFRATILIGEHIGYSSDVRNVNQYCAVHPFYLNNNPFIRSTWPIANYYQCVTVGHRSILTNATRANDVI